MIQTIPVDSIQRDMLLQPRAELHRDWIEEYAQQMAAGDEFPPIIVYFDGDKHWLADGFHRLYAAEIVGPNVRADVREGSRRDALLYSVSANGQHGYRRTNDDKRRAVNVLLNDAEWARWSDHEIARQCGVSQPFVSARRPKPAALSDKGFQIAEPRLVTRGGTTYEMNTAPINGGSFVTTVEPEPVTRSAAPVVFDWEAAKLRTDAMDSIRTIASLPAPQEVIAAWVKSSSYGEPIETLEAAYAWLGSFIALYRTAEPARWARVQSALDRSMANAAE